jgi:hypothetical protein
MLNKLALTAAAAAAILGFSTDAHAAPDWHLSAPITNQNGFCEGIGTGIITQVGYYGEPAPRVGHTQDAALVVVVQAGCGPVTAIPSFVLPDDIVQDTDQDVLCIHIDKDERRTAITDPAFCSTHPIPNNLGLDDVFGWSALQPGERLEVYMPVIWLNPRRTTFTAVVNNNFKVLAPTIDFDIVPAPTFDTFAITQNGSTATASFVLRNGEAGAKAVIEYGPTTNYQYATTELTASTTASQSMSFTLSNLQPGTTYHYRVRYLVPFNGAYWSADQTFTTPMAEIVVNPTPSPNPVYPCRFIRCR